MPAILADHALRDALLRRLLLIAPRAVRAQGPVAALLRQVLGDLHAAVVALEVVVLRHDLNLGSRAGRGQAPANPPRESRRSWEPGTGHSRCRLRGRSPRSPRRSRRGRAAPGPRLVRAWP